MSTAPLKTATVLAFERKLDPSDALFHAGGWQQREQHAGWEPVRVIEKSVRGTISNRLKTKDQDPAKLDAQIENPNLQKVDVAALPHHADTLKISFTLRVLGNVGAPSACNDSAYQAKLRATVAGYVQAHGFAELARRYACNLANGRFLWRNRVGAEQVEVRVALLEQGQPAQQWQFDALALSLRHFDPGNQAAALEQLAAAIAAGLAGQRHLLLQITAFARLGAGQEVFPSQELILDRSRGDKSKTLYAIEQGALKIAAIHSQKLGNAIRTIDDWHPEAEQLGPIAVEPYGSVTTLGKACRQPKAKSDFYTLLDNWVLKDQAPAPHDQHFVLATLIRGGVFGAAE
ncbi:CRISPR-associated protein Cas5 [Chromobacterium sp. LK1]|uniref:type I-F CRISPR-associated protein Csy3 n=1 Tax=Chromobacterium sp. LK1 TaxID=1628193 RepID=UPI000654AB1C|nr:type I-F CRISPR-associated protein Csy3 [Chromobacterium sp. LK1]KMN36675.1 CRISPR-associated protein Cas5 [Chromobacterium sp. LK1]